MGQPQYPPPASERWSINLPLLVGAVFVFLVAVVIWVIAATGGDEDPDSIASSSTTSSSTSSTTSSTAIPTTTSTTMLPGTTTPAPMPDPTAVTTTLPVPVPVPVTSAPAPSTTAVPPTTQPPPATTAVPTTQPAPPTTAEGADPGAVPGDLGIPGVPMQAPPCNDSYITVIASAVGGDVAAGVEVLLDEFPTSNYLRTDQTCPSLTQDIDGEPIYVVYFGPFAFADDACAARSDGTEDSYARILSESEPPEHIVDCPV